MSGMNKLDQKAIDALYGLEPVYEPDGAESSSPVRFVQIDCPYCGERFETAADLSAGSFSYVEDCQVCCQPIVISGEVDEAGVLVGLSAGREG